VATSDNFSDNIFNRIMNIVRKITPTLFFSIVFCLASLNAQNLFIYDQQTGLPISDVYIYNDQKTTTALTDEIGIANISDFSQDDHINFQHPSYMNISLSLATIITMKYKVALSQKLVDLKEVVVSANKWESDINEVPNKIEVINARDIVFNNPATSADLLASGNHVYVQKSQLGGGSPMLRGFAANRILFIVDGVRMNNAIYRSGNLQNVLQTDVNSVETAEIIFGPGTNIYGSDALGGVIDFHTLKPKLSSSERWVTSGHGLARITSAEFEKTVHADINFGNNKWAILASISYSDFDDLKMGSMHNDYTQRAEFVTQINDRDSIVPNSDPDIQKFSGYHQLSFISKVRHQFSETVDWTLSFYLTQTGDVPRYDRLLQYSGDELKYAEWYYQPQQWLMNSLEINFSNQTKIYDHFSIVMAFQNVKEGRNDRKYQDDWLRKRTEKVNIFSGNVDFDKALRWNSFIFYGLEFVYNDVVSKGEKENIRTGDMEIVAPRYPDGSNKYIQAGIYFSYKKNLNNAPVTLQAGLRYSFTNLKSLFNDTSYYHLPYNEIKINNNAITASAGIVYRPGSWQFKANLSSGFRAPNLDDVAKIFDSEPGNVVVPNENLKPEYLYNADIGIIYKLTDLFNIELTGFYSYLKNAMVRRDFQINGQDSIIYDGELSKVQAVVNTGSAVIYGASLRIDWQVLRFLGFNQSLTYTKGEDDEGFAMRHAPPLFGASTITFEQNQLKISINASYNAEISYDNLAPSERSKAYLYATDSNGNPYAPAWWTLNFKGSYAFSQSFLVTIGVDNIMDYRYRAYSSGITAPGRNFIASFRYSF